MRAGNGRIYPLERETIVDLLTNTLKKDCYVKKENRTVYNCGALAVGCQSESAMFSLISDHMQVIGMTVLKTAKILTIGSRSAHWQNRLNFIFALEFPAKTQEIKEIYEIIYRYFDRMASALFREQPEYI